jgi:hypothetical protein
MLPRFPLENLLGQRSRRLVEIHAVDVQHLLLEPDRKRIVQGADSLGSLHYVIALLIHNCELTLRGRLGIECHIPLAQADLKWCLKNSRELRSGVAHKDVQPPELRPNHREHPADLLGLGDVGLQNETIGTAGSNLFQVLIGRRGVLVVMNTPLAPRSASASAILRPMPRELPVIKACLLFSDIPTSLWSSVLTSAQMRE